MIRRHDGLDLSANQHCSQGHRCWKLTINNLLSANHPVGQTHYALRLIVHLYLKPWFHIKIKFLRKIFKMF